MPNGEGIKKTRDGQIVHKGTWYKGQPIDESHPDVSFSPRMSAGIGLGRSPHLLLSNAPSEKAIIDRNLQEERCSSNEKYRKPRRFSWNYSSWQNVKTTNLHKNKAESASDDIAAPGDERETCSVSDDDDDDHHHHHGDEDNNSFFEATSEAEVKQIRSILKSSTVKNKIAMEQFHPRKDLSPALLPTVNTKAQKLANMQPFGIPAAGYKIVLRRSSTAAMLNQGRHRERYTGAGLKSPLGRSKQVIFDGASISRSREKKQNTPLSLPRLAY